MSNSDWLTIEKLVQLIEKSISPDSKVEHNVKLPDLTSVSNAKCQCDVVITTGNAPRQTITIVEIQSRNKKFDITFFKGLIQKMRDVGAQHLICVSTEGFTSTIKEKAKSLGGTVRLIKLTKHSTNNLPVNFSNLKFTDDRPVYDFNENPRIVFKRMGGKETKINLGLGNCKFILNNISALRREFGIKELVEDYFESNQPEIDGLYKVKLPKIGESLTIEHLDMLLEVENFEWNIFVKIRRNDIPIFAYSYEQEEAGPIAWVLEGISTIDGETKMLRATVNFSSENNLIITGIQWGSI